MFKNVLIALSLFTSTMVSATELQADLNSDGIRETYRLNRGTKGKTLQVSDSNLFRDVSIKDSIPFNYKFIKVVKNNCIRIGVPSSDDFYDICSKNDNYYAVASPALR